jgi:hypothetical protein
MLQVFYLDLTYVLQLFQVFFSGVFASVLDAYFKCLICLQTNVASLDVSKVIGCYIFLIAFCCLILVSPPPGAGWASEIEAQADTAPSPSS